MAIQVSYPGVYVQEIPSTTPTVAGVSTASTAFVDFFRRGPMNTARKITNFEDFSRIYGGLDTRSEASYGIMQYFNNGGKQAWLVRTGTGAMAATLTVEVNTPTLREIVSAAQRAVDAATQAAKKASAAAGDAKTARDNQKAKALEAATEQTAQYTRETSDATEEAAAQAQNASAVLNLEIQKAEAAGGPLSDQTVAAAAKSAAAAGEAKNAAEAGRDAAAAAEAALTAAQAAVTAGQKARLTSNLVEVLATELQASQSAAQVDTSQKAATDAKTAADKITDDKQLDTAKTEAQNAASNALTAAQKAQTAAQQSLDAANLALDDGAGFTIREQMAKAGQAANDAMEASKSALKATDLASAKAAATSAATAATNAQSAAQTADLAALQAAAGVALSAGKGSASLTDTLKTNFTNFAASGTVDKRDDNRNSLIDFALALAKETATNAANAAAPADTNTLAPDDTTAFAVAKRAQDSVNKAISASTNALSNAQGAAQSARQAAESAGAAEPAAAAQGTLVSAQQAAKSTRDANKTALTVSDRLTQMLDDTSKAAKAARDAAAATSAANSENPQKLATATTAADAAIDAANKAQAATEGVEDAATAAAGSSVQAARSADIGAEAAMAAAAALDLASTPLSLIVKAANEGVWGNSLQVSISWDNPGRTAFSLKVEEWVIVGGQPRRVNAENYMKLNLDLDSSRCAPKVVNDTSLLVQLTYSSGPPPGVKGAYPQEIGSQNLNGGVDGDKANATDLTACMRSALTNIAPDIFNLLCLPSTANYSSGEAQVALSNAMDFCREQRAFLLVDIPASVNTVDKVKAWLPGLRNAGAYHSAIYFPRLIIADPLEEFRPRNVGPSGTLAGIYASTDASRGVWKAPAGITAVISGADIAVKVNDIENGYLNPLGINVLRSFPVYGNISWGARTMAGADAYMSEWKYISERRLANYIEESLYQSLKWAVFEPNDERLWSKIRLQVGTFMAGLFADGAFQGSTPAAAYFVRCDATTTTPVDIDLGIVNVMVGFAPVKPAEFVVLQIQQIAGQAQS